MRFLPSLSFVCVVLMDVFLGDCVSGILHQVTAEISGCVVVSLPICLGMQGLVALSPRLTCGLPGLHEGVCGALCWLGRGVFHGQMRTSICMCSRSRMCKGPGAGVSLGG